jgi:hypothetical protein
LQDRTSILIRHGFQVGIRQWKGQKMDELYSLTVSEERLEDCRDVIEPELMEVIERAISSGFSREEVLIAISELTAEDFAVVVKTPSIH